MPSSFPRALPPCLLAALAALGGCLAPIPNETGTARIANLEAVLAEIEAAPDFDSAVQIALDAGLWIDGVLESSPEGRHVLVVEPTAPDRVYMALGEDAQVPTTRQTRWEIAGGAYGRCQVTGTGTHVSVYPDGKVYALTGSYRVDLDLCDPAHAWQCNNVSAAVQGATALLDGAGGARSGAGAGANERIVVRAAAMGPISTLADAYVAVGTFRSSKTCTVRINTDQPSIQAIVGRWNATDQAALQAIVQHEIGHCLGLNHIDGASGVFMGQYIDTAAPPAAALPADAQGVLRQLAAGQTIPVTNCRVDCGSKAVYDAAADRCRCKPGAIGVPGVIGCWGGSVEEPSCGCVDGRCADLSTGASCSSCSTDCTVEEPCACVDGSCVEPRSGAACTSCWPACEPEACECRDGDCVDGAGWPCSSCATDCEEPSECECRQGECVDARTGGRCDECEQDCRPVGVRICACDFGQCVDVETGKGCDLCMPACGECEDRCESTWGECLYFADELLADCEDACAENPEGDCWMRCDQAHLDNVEECEDQYAGCVNGC